MFGAQVKHLLSLAIMATAAHSAAANVTGFDDATLVRLTRLSLQEERPPAVTCFDDATLPRLTRLSLQEERPPAVACFDDATLVRLTRLSLQEERPPAVTCFDDATLPRLTRLSLQEERPPAVACFDDATLPRMTRLSLQVEPPPAVATETPPPEPAAPGEFEKGAWTFQTYGSAIFGDADKGEMYLAHVGAGRYIADDVSLSLELFGGYIRSGIDDNGGAVGADAVVRWHFSKTDDERRTFFLNGGGGFQQQSTNFSGKRHFNLRVFVGLGATFRIGDKARLLLGANYIHISDAGIEGGGGGFDGPMVYGGIMIPF